MIKLQELLVPETHEINFGPSITQLSFFTVPFPLNYLAMITKLVSKRGQ